jgi:hypothetical protein
MSSLINVTHTPPLFSPVYTDGLFFTVSGNTNFFKFRYVYDIYVDNVLVFQGKATPNPFGLGIIDCSRILKTYVSNIPISMWDTTPIYTHQTFPFSRPYEDVTINYQLKLGMEYADTEFGVVSGFTGQQAVVSGQTINVVGPPSVPTNIFKTYQATMGVNGRATQQDFDMGPFVLSGTPVNTQPTTSGLFLTNSPRIRDIQPSEYYTLGFTNWWLDSSVVSEPYYSEYKFYDEVGSLIETRQYQNLTTNGGGPLPTCGLVYQSYFSIEPKSATTFNTLYVGAGPENIYNFPQDCAQYTVQLFGRFTGTTQPVPTPTPPPTPTPTPAPPCTECYDYDIYNPSPVSLCEFDYFDCTLQRYTSVLIGGGQSYRICSCSITFSYECFLEITTVDRCPTPPPCENCFETAFCNDNLETECFVTYYDCDLGYYNTIIVLPNTCYGDTPCACSDWTSSCPSGITATQFTSCAVQPCANCNFVTISNNSEIFPCEVQYFDCETQQIENITVPQQTARQVCACVDTVTFQCADAYIIVGPICP